MERLKKLYREILLPACLVFTLLCFGFSLILDNANTGIAVPTINLGNITQIFVFSMIFSASWQLFAAKKLPFWSALVLHFLSFLANIAIVFFLIGGHYRDARNAFVVLVVFALIYVIVAAIAVTVRHFVFAAKDNKKAYKKQF
jgi:hypothetical protein